MKSSKTKRAASGRSAAAAVALPQPAPFYMRPDVLGAAAAIIAVFMIYGPAMSGPFLLDDNYLPYRSPRFYNMPWRFWIIGNRPLLNLSFWANFRLSGENSYGYHFFNVVLHLFNGGWIYLALRKLLDWAGTAKWTREVTGVFAAGLFLVHPLQTESVTYVASRSETLSVFFFLAAFVVFLYGRPATLLRIAFVLALYAAAGLSKEHTVILPALLLLSDYWWNPGFTFQGIRSQWKLYSLILMLGVAGGLFLWFTVLKRAATAGFGVTGITWYQYYFTECRVIWRYIFAFIFPLWLNLDADVPISRNIVDHLAIGGVIAVLAVSVAAWIYRRRYPLASYGWFVFLLLLAPTSSFIPIIDPYAERRLYLPFIGLLLIVAEIVSRWKTTRNTAVVTLGVILLCEAGLTYARNGLWSDPVAIWKDSAEKSPQKVRPSFQYAFALYLSGRCAESANEFSRTASLDKPTYDLLLDWGLAYACAGNKDQAIAKLRESARLQPSAHIYSQIAKVYAENREYPEALEALRLAEQIDPLFSITYFYRGNVYLVQGDNAAAAKEYRHSLKLDPGNQQAIDALARTGQ